MCAYHYVSMGDGDVYCMVGVMQVTVWEMVTYCIIWDDACNCMGDGDVYCIIGDDVCECMGDGDVLYGLG